MVNRKFAYKQPKDAIAVTIHELAEFLDLPNIGDFEERNQEWISQQAFYARRDAEAAGELEDADPDEFQIKVEENLQKELFEKWVSAVEFVAEQIYEAHGLRVKRVAADTKYLLTPQQSWLDVATKIAQTVNGVGLVHVPTKDYSRGPKTWVANHLKSMQVYPEVYGTPSTERLFERALS